MTFFVRQDRLPILLIRVQSRFELQAEGAVGASRRPFSLKGIHEGLKQAVQNRSIECHGHLPLWVASKCMTFGNLSSFFDLQQQRVKTKTCVVLARSLGRGVVRQRDLVYSLHTLPDFRNICAHDERLYCARVGKNSDKGFPELLRALKTVVTDQSYQRYIGEVADMVNGLEEAVPSLKTTFLDGMGISMEDLAAQGE